MTYTINLIHVFILFLTTTYSCYASSIWVSHTETDLSNAVLSHKSNPGSYICRGEHLGIIYSGTVQNQKCKISVNNSAIQLDEYEILTNQVNKLSSYKPNYVVYVPEQTDKPAGDDEHLEFFYSFKYRISDYRFSRLFDNNNYFYISYTGKFDFYTDIIHDTPDSRKSSPVINRLSNPELHYRIYLSPKEQKHDLFSTHLDFAFGHESNGQTLDVDSYQAYRDNTQDGAHYTDYISRGWDYLSLEYKLEYNKNNCKEHYFSCLYGYLYLRRFYDYGPLQKGIDDDIFWPSNGDANAEIRDYDGLRLIFGKEYPATPGNPPDKGYWITYRTGHNNPGEHNSFTLNLRHDVHFCGLELPVYIKYFKGYGRELTTYHEKNEEWTIGLQFR